MPKAAANHSQRSNQGNSPIWHHPRAGRGRASAAQIAEPNADRVGCQKEITSRDQDIFVDEATEHITTADILQRR